ncbi:MAG TPA: hypothetical protein VKW06_22775 [Candidatus Angelobacter sp.]|nr:hypothetical protein [Candidatus Angelobacter sp.]
MSLTQGVATKVDPGQAKAAADPKKPADPRRERRVHIAVPVKVFADVKTVDFQTCCTYEISTIGVRLVASQGIKEVGQVIVLQRQNRRARFKVTWIGKPNTAESGQVGVESLEPNNVIWENEIKARLAQAD